MSSADSAPVPESSSESVATAAPEAGGATSTSADCIFVHAYHNLPGHSEAEWVDYSSPTNLDRLRRELKDYIDFQIDRFSESIEYGEYFSLADYGDTEELISADERLIFRTALSEADRQHPLDKLHPRDTLAGYRTVMLARVRSGNLAALQDAVSLFNHVIEAAIEGVDDRNARFYIRIGTARDFAPSFIDGLLASIARLSSPKSPSPYERFVGEAFAPVEPLLQLLRRAVQRPEWPHSDIALGKFLLIVDYFKQVVEDQWST